jgi:hypothetical protein
MSVTVQGLILMLKLATLNVRSSLIHIMLVLIDLWQGDCGMDWCRRRILWGLGIFLLIPIARLEL